MGDENPKPDEKTNKKEDIPQDDVPKTQPEPVQEEPVKEDEDKPVPEVKNEEQLSVLREVRGELVKAYKEHQTLNKSIEELSKDLNSIKVEHDSVLKTSEDLKKELDVYKAREDEAKNLAHSKRLEQLSKDFVALGQPKTVEELSKLPQGVIGEFEQITKLAIKQKSEEKLSFVTVPTTGMANKKEETLSVDAQKSNKPDFSFEGLCKSLQNQQNKNGSNSQRTLNI